jgi:hypothetical protein
MDLIDEQKVANVIINPALDRLEKEVIPQLRDVLTEVVAKMSTVADTLVADVSVVELSAAADLRRLVAGFDGWTLTIQVPPITIRLNAPKVIVGLPKGEAI